MKHIRAILQRLPQNHLHNKAEKCQFHSDTLSFMGFILSVGQIKMNLAKLEAVKNWSVPENQKAFQWFLGFANFYQCFICHYSSTASPLHQLTSTKAKFTWSQEAERAFSLLRERFTSPPTLTLPDPSRHFIVGGRRIQFGSGCSALSDNNSDLALSFGFWIFGYWTW